MEKSHRRPRMRGGRRPQFTNPISNHSDNVDSPSPVTVPVPAPSSATSFIISKIITAESMGTRERSAIEKKVKEEAQRSGHMDPVATFVFADRQGLPSATWPFLIVDFNVYGPYQDGRNMLYIPGEVGIVAFSVNSGIIDSYSSRIDPGVVPLGSGLSIMTGIRKRGLPYPGFSKEHQNHAEIFENLKNFVKSHSGPNDQAPMLFFFNEDDNASIVPGCFRWLHHSVFGRGNNSYDDHPFRVQPLTKLLHSLSTLGSSMREVIDPVENVPEFEGISKTRKDMTINHGLGRLNLNPVIPSHSQEFGYFPGTFNGQYCHRTDAEQIMERLGKFFSEGHARRYFRTSNSNLFNEDLACVFHKKAENQDPGMLYCSELVTKKLALNMYDALHPVFNHKI